VTTWRRRLQIAISIQCPPGRFITLSVRAGEVLADQRRVLAWLQTPNPSFRGRTPLEATATEEDFQDPDAN
jgi:hypothetical protein